MPHSHADEGQQLVDDVRRGHQGAALAPVVRTLADGGLAGGIIYDALAARAAAKTRAERILTLNRRDFDRLEAIFGVRVATP